MYVLLNIIELEYQFLVARNPMDNWISQVTLPLSFASASLKLSLGLLLQLMSVLMTRFDTRSADLEAIIDIR